jgi:tetratricopeptide (TPR) repeat protein
MNSIENLSISARQFADKLLLSQTGSGRTQLLATTSKMGHPTVYLSRVADLVTEQARYDVASEVWKHVLLLEPNCLKALASLSQLLFATQSHREAIPYLEAWIQRESDSSLPLALLGSTYMSLQRWHEASEAFEKALAIDPDELEVLTAATSASWKANRTTKAFQHIFRLISLDPESARIQNDLGVMFTEVWQPDLALKAFAEALRLAPGMALAHHHMAGVLQRLGRSAEALKHAQKAFECGNPTLDIVTNLGMLLSDHGQYGESVEILASIDVFGSPEVLRTYCNALRQTKHHDEAVVLLDQALQAEPANPDHWLLFGRVKMEKGNFKEAEEAFGKSIELAPHHGGAHRHKSMVRQYSPGDSHLAQMKAVVASINPWTTEYVELEFAIGKAYDDLKEYAQAMKHFNRANGAMRKTIPYDEESLVQHLEHVISMLADSPPQDIRCATASSISPIFIVGMPRSGTTLLERIVANHSEVIGLGELTEFQSALEEVIFKMPRRLGQLPTVEDFVQVGRKYVSRIAPSCKAYSRATDKMPSNSFYLGFIAQALPDAQIVHIKRNPVDTCISLYSKLFPGLQSFSYDLAELGRYYRYYERQMEHWRKVLSDKLFIEVEYESLVQNTEAEVRRLLKFLDLPWEDACLEPHKSKAVVLTSSAVQIRQPIYKTSIGRREGYVPYLEVLIDELEGKKAL